MSPGRVSVGAEGEGHFMLMDRKQKRRGNQQWRVWCEESGGWEYQNRSGDYERACKICTVQTKGHCLLGYRRVCCLPLADWPVHCLPSLSHVHSSLPPSDGPVHCLPSLSHVHSSLPPPSDGPVHCLPSLSHVHSSLPPSDGPVHCLPSLSHVHSSLPPSDGPVHCLPSLSHVHSSLPPPRRTSPLSSLVITWALLHPHPPTLLWNFPPSPALLSITNKYSLPFCSPLAPPIHPHTPCHAPPHPASLPPPPSCLSVPLQFKLSLAFIPF